MISGREGFWILWVKEAGTKRSMPCDWHDMAQGCANAKRERIENDIFDERLQIGQEAQFCSSIYALGYFSLDKQREVPRRAAERQGETGRGAPKNKKTKQLSAPESLHATDIHVIQNPQK